MHSLEKKKSVKSKISYFNQKERIKINPEQAEGRKQERYRQKPMKLKTRAAEKK